MVTEMLDPADVPGAGEVSVEVDREYAALLAVADDEALFQFASILNQLQDAIGPPPDVRLIPLQYAEAADVVGFLDDYTKIRNERSLGLTSRQKLAGQALVTVVFAALALWAPRGGGRFGRTVEGWNGPPRLNQ